MATSSDKVPPVPVTTDVITPSGAPVKVGKETVPTASIFRGQKFTNTWNQWFVAVKDKIDIINASIVALSQFTGIGFISRRPDGTYVSRTISGTSGEVSVANGDGVAGNPTVGLVNTAVTPGSYGDTTHWPTFTVDSKGRLTLVSNQLAPAGSSPLTTKGDLYGFSTINARLPVGTNGQILSADSTQTLGLAWINAPTGTSPLTTKGDVYTYSTVNARLPVGTNGQVLSADSTQTTGLAWVSPGTPTLPITTKGDLLGYSTIAARIPVGTNGQVLTADSTQTLGVKWAAGGGGGSTPTGTGYVHVVAGVQDAASATNTAVARDIGSFNKAGLTVPLVSTFTTFGTITLTDKVGRFQVIPTQAPGQTLVGGRSSIPSPPYTIDVGWSTPGRMLGSASQGIYFGLNISDGTKYIGIYLGMINGSNTGRIQSQAWNSATSFSGTTYLNDFITSAGFNTWLRITDDGTNRTYFVSANGLDFTQVLQQTTNTFLTPTSAGFVCTGNDSTGDQKITVYHYLVTNSILGDAP